MRYWLTVMVAASAAATAEWVWGCVAVPVALAALLWMILGDGLSLSVLRTVHGELGGRGFPVPYVVATGVVLGAVVTAVAAVVAERDVGLTGTLVGIAPITVVYVATAFGFRIAAEVFATADAIARVRSLLRDHPDIREACLIEVEVDLGMCRDDNAAYLRRNADRLLARAILYERVPVAATREVMRNTRVLLRRELDAAERLRVEIAAEAAMARLDAAADKA